MQYLKKIKREIDTYVRICEDVLQDIEYASSDSNALLYNIDFCILYPYLWKTQPESIPPYKPYGSRIFETLTFINKAKPGFKLVFTGPSFWELLDSIAHQIKYLKGLGYKAISSHKKIMSIIDQKKDIDCLESQFLKAGVAKQELNCFRAVDFREEVRKPIQVAYDLIGPESILQGLGDYVKYNQNFNLKFQNIYQKVFDDMFSRRSKATSDTRDREARKFHYGVDSANITSLHAVNYSNDDVRLCYVSDPDLINTWCPDFGRNPLTPYYWISSILLKKDNYVGSERAFFEAMITSAQKIDYELKELSSISSIPGYLTKLMVEFYQIFVLPLRKAKNSIFCNEEGNGNKVLGTEKDGAFQDLIKAPKKFKERFYQAAEGISTEAKKLFEKHEYFLEDELVQLTDFKSSPILEEIKETLGVR